MVFWNLKTTRLEAFKPGIMSRAEIGDHLIMVYMEIDSGKEDIGHEHPFDQCGVILEGRMEMFVGKERKVLDRGDAYFIASGERHGWRTFDRKVKLLDVSQTQKR
jgi:quercetin dioxygenase-like cupin family protein